MYRPTDKEVETIIEAHEAWLAGSKQRGRQANFTNMDLSGYNFHDSNKLLKAIFDDANLAHCVFVDADLRSAYFRRTNLRGARFSGCLLTDADARHSDLSDTVFRYSTMIGKEWQDTDMTRSIIEYSTLLRWRRPLDGNWCLVDVVSSHFDRPEWTLEKVEKCNGQCCVNYEDYLRILEAFNGRSDTH